MKITATKDFGNTKNNKIVLSLVPEPTETATKKEDLATLNVCSDPTDADSTKVRFAFKTFNGTAESPQISLTGARTFKAHSLVSTPPQGHFNVR